MINAYEKKLWKITILANVCEKTMENHHSGKHLPKKMMENHHFGWASQVFLWPFSTILTSPEASSHCAATLPRVVGLTNLAHTPRVLRRPGRIMSEKDGFLLGKSAKEDKNGAQKRYVSCLNGRFPAGHVQLPEGIPNRFSNSIEL